MAGTVQPPRARAGVTFALESMKVEDGQLVITGHWGGVRGMRFVRPTLVAGGREVLATLDHKPWAPDSDPWTAAFPWDEGEADAGGLALSVAPSVTVPLAEDVPAPSKKKQPSGGAAALHDEVRRLRLERDALREQLDEAIRDRDAALRTRRRMESQRDEAFAERNAAERERDRTAAERDQAVARRDAAIRDHRAATDAHRAMQEQRDAALAERRQAVERRDAAVGEQSAAIGAHHELQAQRDEALAALRTAEAERDAAGAERDAAARQRDEMTRQRDEVRAQRDDALLAQRALQRRIDEELADRDRARRHEERRAERAAPPEPPAPDGDRPIGVRTVPAARSLSAGLDSAHADRGRGMLTKADVLAIRLLGTIAAVCFVLLLLTLLRLFV
jgi:hypothetical protein